VYERSHILHFFNNMGNFGTSTNVWSYRYLSSYALGVFRGGFSSNTVLHTLKVEVPTVETCLHTISLGRRVIVGAVKSFLDDTRGLPWVYLPNLHQATFLQLVVRLQRILEQDFRLIVVHYFFGLDSGCCCRYHICLFRIAIP
jgi:hypothetical protein